MKIMVLIPVNKDELHFFRVVNKELFLNKELS
jgi:hypothetical protein